MWFKAKDKQSFVNAPRLVLRQLELARLQKKKVKIIVAPHIARSAWYSHSVAEPAVGIKMKPAVI